MSVPHLLMVSRILPFHSIGGMQSVAWDLARELAAQGIRVTFLTTRIPQRDDTFEQDGVTVVAAQAAPPGRYSRRWWRASRECFQQNLSGSVTTVLSISAGGYALLTEKDRNPGMPFALQVHGTSVSEVASKWRTREPRALLTSVRNFVWIPRDVLAYRRFDPIIVVGQGLRADLARPPLSWFVAPERVHVIPNGVETRLFAPNPAVRRDVRVKLDVGADDPVVISVSRLHRLKGLDLSLRGFACLASRSPGARFLIVGDGPERTSLEDLSRELGVGPRVWFLGATDRETVARYLQAADVLLFTTRHREGLPLSVLEALASGLPVIVSRHLQSLRELSAGVHGVNSEDPKAIASQLGVVLAASETRESLLPAEYGLSRVTGEYRRVLGL